MENQLIGADTLEIRQTVDQAYEKIVQSMFDALKHMAKMDGEGEDKGQLNYHVIIIGKGSIGGLFRVAHFAVENMHYFVAEMSQLQLGSVAAFLKRAESIYEENLNAYVKIVLRRPFYKIVVSRPFAACENDEINIELGLLRGCGEAAQDNRTHRGAIQQQLQSLGAEEGRQGIQLEGRAKEY